jgi:hypothetical protein
MLALQGLVLQGLALLGMAIASCGDATKLAVCESD